MQPLINLIQASNPLALILWAVIYFLLIYVLFSSLVCLVAKIIYRPIETKPVRTTQLRTEWLNSIRSIIIFGVGIVVPWLMIQQGIASISTQSSALKIILDCFILILWNDLHFYVVHRLLHAKLKWVHVTHHKSVTATPFTAYSMSATEAVLLGSVMPIAMLAHEFSLIALLLLPIWSIIINTIAHSNCDFFPNAREDSLLSLVKHHQSHHSRYHGNYSFMFTQLDCWFSSSQTIINKDMHDSI
jgi:Delta7-sterol 5-desaturase